jgi:hypothetical protein
MRLAPCVTMRPKPGLGKWQAAMIASGAIWSSNRFRDSAACTGSLSKR